MRKIFLAGAAISALGAGQAWGQAVDQGAQSAGIETVVVTAQKREEDVQKIPVAVAVVSATQLEQANANNIGDVAALSPSITFAQGNEGRNSSIRIRGVGTDVFSTGVESSVSTVIDGVVYNRPGAAFADLGDIQRIEILRGPQGTLFGKNSSAGAINVLTNSPNFDAFEESGNLLIAQDNEYRANGVISGPITDNLAFRVYAFHRDQGGLVKNLYSGNTVDSEGSDGVRGKLGWKPIEHLDLEVSADFARFHSSNSAWPLRVATTNPVTPITGTPVGPNNTQVNNDVFPFVKQRNYGYSLTANYDLNDYTITSITAYRRFYSEVNDDLDDTQAKLAPFNNNLEDNKTVTQELRLTSPKSDIFDYVVGFFYLSGDTRNFLYRQGLNVGAVTSINADGSLNTANPYAYLTGTSIVSENNVSGYFQGNLHLGDKLTLTGGLRYLEEKQQLDFSRTIPGYFNGPNAAQTNVPLGPVTGHYNDTALIGKVSAEYAFTDAVNGYVNYSTGYKGQGIAATQGLSPAQFVKLPAPAETSTLWEAGLKTRLWDDLVQLNLTAFRTRFQNYQGQVYNAALGLVALTSVGEVAIDGGEAEIIAKPIAGLDLTGGLTYLNARFQNVPNGPCYNGQTVAQGCTAANGVSTQNLNGKPFINAPKWRMTMGARYTFPLFEGVDGYVYGDYHYQSKVLFDLSQDPNMQQKAYGIADFSVGSTFGDEGQYDLSFYMKNAFDQHYVSNVMVNGAIGGAGAYSQAIPRDFSRYVGGALHVNF